MPATARAAKATRDFFIASFSKVKHRAPVRRAHRDWHLVLPPDPGPTSFWEVVAIAPEPLREGKANRPKTRPGEAFRCSGATKLLHASPPHDVKRLERHACDILYSG